MNFAHIKTGSSPYGNCCDNQAVQAFDQRIDGILYRNRLCLKCKTHWYGPENGVIQYTSTQWDVLMNKVEASQ